MLKDGGVAIMSTGYGEGDNRVTKAFQEALHSPLLNNNDIYNSKKVLFYISFSRSNENDQLTMEEMNEVNDFMAKFQQETLETKWGMGIDDTLGNKVKITLLASGFGLRNIPGMEEVEMKHLREDEEELRKQEEERELHAERRSHYYADDENRPQKPRRQIFVFSEKDLDDDDIISMVESTPTADRKKDKLKQIQEKSASENASHAEGHPAASGTNASTVDFTITF